MKEVDRFIRSSRGMWHACNMNGKPKCGSTLSIKTTHESTEPYKDLVLETGDNFCTKCVDPFAPTGTVQVARPNLEYICRLCVQQGIPLEDATKHYAHGHRHFSIQINRAVYK